MPILDTLRPTPDLRVLVTAGASGPGAAIARAFYEAGSRVHVCDIDRAALDRLHVDMPDITGSMADVSVDADVDLVFDDIRGTLGGLDVLVNAAGITGPAAAIECIERSGWERTIAVNLNGLYYFARRAVPMLRQSRADASMIAVGSIVGTVRFCNAPHALTRWAIVGLVKSLALELGVDGIRVNAILPGTTAENVAGVALFLCSPAARCVTGQAISLGSNHPAD